MQIWVDADACPNVIKQILFQTAERLQLHTTLVANQLISIPASRFIKSIQVAAGFDVADQEIVKLMVRGDLVVTSDIPLVSDVLGKGGYALNPRGSFYTSENIQEEL